MRRYPLVLPLCASMLASAPLLVGCDQTVEHERKVDVKDDGTVVREEKKVTESPGGDVTRTETKSVDK